MKVSIAVHTTKGTIDYINFDLWDPSPVSRGVHDIFLLLLMITKKGKAYFLKT